MRNSMRISCISGYEWPMELIHFTDVLNSLDGKIDLEAFLKIIQSYDTKEDVIVTLLSKEYLNVGKIWLAMLKRIGIKQYVVIAADIDTGVFLDSINVPNCKIIFAEDFNSNENFRSRTGFTDKGLAVTALKYPTVKLILELGYNVLLMDIDSLLFKKPSQEYFINVDIAFQRVVNFPDPIAEIWGFAACSGFVWFRSNRNTIALIDNAIAVQRKVYSDQIALNVALWESNIEWNQSNNYFKSVSSVEDENRLDSFRNSNDENFDGIGKSPSLKVRALPPNTFWRDNIVPLDLSKLILFHPVSPKEEKGKLDVFKEHNIF